VIELLIDNGKAVFEPVTVGEATYESFWRGRAGRLTFRLIESADYPVSEGCSVSFKTDGKGLFFGVVFSRKKEKGDIVTVTAYDQLRYLKNKDVYAYTEKRASDIVRMIAGDYRLKIGAIAKTSYVIPSRVEENVPLFDIIENALDLERQYKGGRYTLFDDFGKLTLLGAEEMNSGVLIDADTAEDYLFLSSADDRFNRVKLQNSAGGVFIAEDAKSRDEVGILQYYAKVGKKENGGEKSRGLLKLLNRNKRGLSVRGSPWDSGVRGGSTVTVRLGGELNWTAAVKSAAHRFAGNSRLMDLELEEI